MNKRIKKKFDKRCLIRHYKDYKRFCRAIKDIDDRLVVCNMKYDKSIKKIKKEVENDITNLYNYILSDTILVESDRSMLEMLDRGFKNVMCIHNG